MRHPGLYSLEGTNHFNIARGGTPFSATVNAGLDDFGDRYTVNARRGSE
jgi:hypothetical protein